MTNKLKRPLSRSTLTALGMVRGSGGDVSDYALDLACKIDHGELTTEEAIELTVAKAIKEDKEARDKK